MTESERYIACKDWVLSGLYQELIQMPIWTYAAFGQLKDGDVLDQFDPRMDLIRYLVKNHIQKIPDDMYDAEFHHNWKVQQFMEAVKAAVKAIEKARQKRT